MICNSEAPMCIAGVFGGLESGVSESTTSIFLESAYFDAVSVRKTARRHGLNTDASFRFERGTDPNNTVYAMKRAALLIKEIAGGTISSEVIDLYPNPAIDVLNLSYPDDLKGSYWEILAIDGKRIRQGSLNSSSVDVSDLNKGAYLFIVEVDGRREVKRWLKN